MSIFKENGKYTLACDFCGEEIRGCESFDEALEVIEEREWKTIKENGEFIHCCYYCQEGEK